MRERYETTKGALKRYANKSKRRKIEKAPEKTELNEKKTTACKQKNICTLVELVEISKGTT